MKSIVGKSLAEILQAELEDDPGAKIAAVRLGNIADAYFQTREKRLALDKESDALKKDEAFYQQLLIDQLKLQDITAIGGKLISVKLAPLKNKPHVTDWPEFYKYILKTKDFSLLQRRPGEAAIAERWDDGKVVPGVEKFPVATLSVSKVK